MSYANKNLYDRLVDRHGELKTQRQPYEPCWDEIIDYYRPDIERIERKMGGYEGIDFLGEHMFESTPSWSAQLMAEGWQGYLASRSIDWFKHQLDDMKGINEVNKWLQLFDEYMYSVYKNSTFYENLGDFCLDGVTVGSPVMIIEEKQFSDKIYNHVPHPAERFLGQNAFGETDTLHLSRERTVKEAFELYAKFQNVKEETGTVRRKANENFSSALMQDWREGHYSQKRTFIRCYHYFMDPIFEGLTGKDKPFAPWMCYTLELDNDKKKVCKTEPYWEKPFIDWPYRKRSNRAYAVTPAWLSYYDALSLQDAREGVLMAGKLINRPPMWLPGYMKKNLELYPEGMNFFKNKQEYELKPEPIINVHGNSYPIGKDMEGVIKEDVKRWFYVDFFLMLQRWSTEQKAPPTAYHIMKMLGEKAILLAPRIGNFTRRLEEIDTRMIGIEERAGRIPTPPPIVMEMSNGKLKPEFIGPLAQVQNQYHETARMENTMIQVQPFLNLDPLSARMIKAEIAIERILESNRFYQDAITSQEEYNEIKAAIAQQQELQQGVQLGTEVAKALPGAGKAIEKNSPIVLLTGAA